MNKKIKVIDQIVERHPACGVSKGWSKYVGGMMDTGEWYYRKMLDVPLEELESFLKGIIEVENKPKPEITEDTSPRVQCQHKGKSYWTTEQELKLLQEFRQRCAEQILFGK